MTWTETRPGAWTAELGDGRVELLLVDGEVTAWWWCGGVVRELDLGAERAGIFRRGNPPATPRPNRARSQAAAPVS
jgi:hypothetical protein